MIICHPLKLIFMKTKKVGGTSFEIALSSFCGPDCVITPISPSDEASRQERGFRGAQNTDSQIWPNGSRSVGRFYNHMSAAEAHRLIPREIWDNYTKIAIVRDPHDVAVSRYYWEGGPRIGVDFGQFVDRCRTTLTENAEIAPFDGPFAVDRFLRYEVLENDIADLGIPGLWETFSKTRAKSGLRPRNGASAKDMFARYPTAAEVVARECVAELSTFGYPSKEVFSSPARLQTCKLPRDLIFTLSSGRTGTSWLANFLGQNLGVDAIHEPLEIDNLGLRMPEIRTMRAFNTYGMDAHVRSFWKRKFAAISGPHVETNHTLAKCGLIEALVESPLADRATVIVLRRDLAEQCASYVMRGDFVNVTLEWQWYLSPGYPNAIVKPDKFLPLGPAGRAIWYALEMEARQAYYLRRYGHRVNFVEVRLDDVTTHDGAARLLADLGQDSKPVLPARSNAMAADPGIQKALKEEIGKTIVGLGFDPERLAQDFLAQNRILSSPLRSAVA